jgi:hypothetical protein
VLIEIIAIVENKCRHDTDKNPVRKMIKKQADGVASIKDESDADANDMESMLRNRPEIDSNYLTPNLANTTQHVSQCIMAWTSTSIKRMHILLVDCGSHIFYRV